MFSQQFWVLLVSTFALAAPLSLAALGGYASERSGVVNIALEGKMLTSACITFVVSCMTQNIWDGVLAGIASSVVLAWFHWLLTQVYTIDHVVSGMAINALALGGTNFLYVKFESIPGSMPHFPTWTTKIGNQTLDINIFLVLAFVAPIVTYFIVKNTRPGLRLIAVGNDPQMARFAGISTLKVRFVTQTFTGIFTGFAGVLIVNNNHRFTDNMTAGRGYIALAALVMSSWRPIQSMLICLIFGFLQATQIALQGVKVGGVEIPVQVWQSLPYLMAVVALAGIVKQSRAPYGIGKM